MKLSAQILLILRLFPEAACDFNLELIFFVIPLFHAAPPFFSYFLITSIPFYAVFVNKIIDFLSE